MRKIHLMAKWLVGDGGAKRIGNVGACGTMYCKTTGDAERVTCERCKLRVKYGQSGDKISKPNVVNQALSRERQ